MTILRSLVVLACAAALVACEKNGVQELTGSTPQAGIRFFNFGVNAPQVNFYADATKLTAIVSATGAESVLGTPYGSVASGGFYSAIAPAQYTFTGRIAAATDKDLVVASVPVPIVAGKAYSYYMSGFYDATAKTVEAFVVEDPLPAVIDFSQSYVRFVHAISNAQPLTLYAKNTVTLAEVPVGGAVAYKGGGAFVPLPGGVYDLGARLAGVSTNAVTRTGVSFSAGKIYTVGARGDITVSSATAVNRASLDNTANR
jgi:Domain of unknown function (DUF4397)